MRYFKSSIVGIVLGGLCLGLSAAPKDPNVAIESVTSFPNEVTLRSARYDTSVSYRVVVQNKTTNSLNRSFYKGDITVTGSTGNDAAIELPVFVEPGAAVSSCTLTNDAKTINCVIGTNGSLPPGAGAAFWVTVKAPTAGTKMTLNTTFGGDEGNGGGNGCCDSVTTTDTTLVDPLTGTSFKSSAKSFIPGGGASSFKFFTGLGEVATKDDPWVTIVTVPPFTAGMTVGTSTLPFTTATLLETPILTSCASYALGCFASDLTMPGTFSSLLIVILWDESKIKPGTKPENVKLFYTHDPNVPPFQVPLCSDVVGTAPTAGHPCLESPPRKFTKQSDPLLPSSFWNDIGFRVLAIDNGRYTN